MSSGEHTRTDSRGERKSRLNPKEALLQVCTPHFIAPNLLAVTPDFIRQQNIHVLALDAEGTFVETWRTQPHPQLAEHIRDLKATLAEQDYPFHVAIVTNRKMRDLATFTAALHWTHELHADLMTSPLFPEWRKPKPKMLELTARQLGVGPQEILMAGDKLTGDVAAGNRAGAQTLYLEEMVGDVDLLGDRIVRRPLEREMLEMIRNRASCLDAPALSPQRHAPSHTPPPCRDIPQDLDWWNPQWKQTELGKALREIPNVVYGYGISHDDSEQKILGSRLLYERGGEIADLITNARLPLTVLSAILRHFDFKKTANGIQIIAEASDFADGWLARRSKRGPTAEGAAADRAQDKKASLVRRVSLLVDGKLTATDVVTRAGADYGMTLIADGLLRGRRVSDVSAVWPGKIATATESLTDTITDRIGERHPHLATTINTIASSGKLGRIPGNWHLWQERHRLREEERPALEQVAADLMGASR